MLKRSGGRPEHIAGPLEMPLENRDVVGEERPIPLELRDFGGDAFPLGAHALLNGGLGFGKHATTIGFGFGDDKRSMVVGLATDFGGFGLGLLDRGVGGALRQHEHLGQALLSRLDRIGTAQPGGVRLGSLDSTLQLGNSALHERSRLGDSVDVGVDLSNVVAAEALVERNVLEERSKIIHAAHPRFRAADDEGPQRNVPSPESADDASQDLHADDHDDRRQIEGDGAQSHGRDRPAQRRQHGVGDHEQKARNGRHRPIRVEWEPAQDDASKDRKQVEIEKKADDEHDGSLEGAASVVVRDFDIGGH